MVFVFWQNYDLKQMCHFFRRACWVGVTPVLQNNTSTRTAICVKWHPNESLVRNSSCKRTQILRCNTELNLFHTNVLLLLYLIWLTEYWRWSNMPLSLSIYKSDQIQRQKFTSLKKPHNFRSLHVCSTNDMGLVHAYV